MPRRCSGNTSNQKKQYPASVFSFRPAILRAFNEDAVTGAR